MAGAAWLIEQHEIEIPIILPVLWGQIELWRTTGIAAGAPVVLIAPASGR